MTTYPERMDYMSDTPIQAAPATASNSQADTSNLETTDVSNETSNGLEGQEVSSTEQQIDNDQSLSNAEKTELKKRLKLKVDGQEIEDEVDFNDEEGLRKKLQLAAVAQRRMQETAEIKKQLSAFFDLVQSNPEKALSELGLNPDEFAEKHLARRVEEMKKSPEQIEKEKREREFEDRVKEIERKERELQQREMDKLQEQYTLQIDRDITEALADQTDLPKSPYIVKRIVDMMLPEIKRGNVEITAKDVIPVLKKQLKNEWQEMFSMMPEDILESVVGKSNIERMRKKRVAAAKKAQVDTAKQITQTGNDILNRDESSAEEKKLKAKDFFKNL